MWDEPFDVSMLGGEGKFVVNCPEEELERELAAILDAHGMRYPDGDSVYLAEDVWGARGYRENFCYYIDGKTVRRGPKYHAEERGSVWNREYKKYTFYSEQDSEISDDSFCSIIGGD